MYLRVPSKRVAMVSKKVFCGAIRPRITGIRERVDPRLSRRSEPWFSGGAATKPGRNLDEVPGAPPNPWRRAPSRDTRDSTVPKPPTTEQVIPAERSREEPLEAAGERMERWRRGWSHLRTGALRCNPPLLLFLFLSHSLSLSISLPHFLCLILPPPAASLYLFDMQSLLTSHPLK